MAELTFIQKRIICDIAREAYDAWCGRAEWERTHAGVHGFNAWRHQEQRHAVGLQSLRLCPDEHYQDLLRHFLRLRARIQAEAQTPSLF